MSLVGTAGAASPWDSSSFPLTAAPFWTKCCSSTFLSQSSYFPDTTARWWGITSPGVLVYYFALVSCIQESLYLHSRFHSPLCYVPLLPSSTGSHFFSSADKELQLLGSLFSLIYLGRASLCAFFFLFLEWKHDGLSSSNKFVSFFQLYYLILDI